MGRGRPNNNPAPQGESIGSAAQEDGRAPDAPAPDTGEQAQARARIAELEAELEATKKDAVALGQIVGHAVHMRKFIDSFGGDNLTPAKAAFDESVAEYEKSFG